MASVLFGMSLCLQPLVSFLFVHLPHRLLIDVCSLSSLDFSCWLQDSLPILLFSVYLLHSFVHLIYASGLSGTLLLLDLPNGCPSHLLLALQVCTPGCSLETSDCLLCHSEAFQWPGLLTFYPLVLTVQLVLTLACPDSATTLVVLPPRYFLPTCDCCLAKVELF